MRNKKSLNKMVFVENEEATDFLDPSAHKSVLGWYFSFKILIDDQSANISCGDDSDDDSDA